ncbi:MAG: 50S ribosomal protein L11 methyltransferase [Chitinophagales bacterium]
MPDYIKIEFEFLNEQQKEIIIALLSEMNYEGFEEVSDLLRAYISTTLFDEKELKTFASRYNLSFTSGIIKNRNWNKEWESNFHPVIIHHPANDLPYVGIRADFHQPIKNVEHEIVITPKMSFGTGHHATTSMMIEMMSELDFSGKRVLDFGTGTGILAIFAEKLGATEIVAIDNDDQSIDNAAENFRSNNCQRISLLKASSAKSNCEVDIILANIIKVVIIENLPVFAEQLDTHGRILLSGLLKDDEQEILKTAGRYNLYQIKKIEDDNWICLQMRCKSSVIS